MLLLYWGYEFIVKYMYCKYTLSRWFAVHSPSCVHFCYFSEPQSFPVWLELFVSFLRTLPTPRIYSPLLSSVSFIILSSFRYKIHLNLIFVHDMKHHFHRFPHGYAIEPFYLIKWLFFSLVTAMSTLSCITYW